MAAASASCSPRTALPSSRCLPTIPSSGRRSSPLPRSSTSSAVRADRREEILSAARSIVYDEGLGALSFGALEKRLAFTRGVITYHFRNKDEIVLALLERAVEDIDGASITDVAAVRSPPERVHTALAAVVHGFLRNPEAAHVLVAFWGRTRRDPEVAALVHRLYGRWRRRCAELITLGQAEGAFRQDVDVDATAANMVGLTTGIVLQHLQQPGLLDVDALLAQAASALLADLQAG